MVNVPDWMALLTLPSAGEAPKRTLAEKLNVRPMSADVKVPEGVENVNVWLPPAATRTTADWAVNECVPTVEMPVMTTCTYCAVARVFVTVAVHVCMPPEPETLKVWVHVRAGNPTTPDTLAGMISVMVVECGPLVPSMPVIVMM